MSKAQLYCGDSIKILRQLSEKSVSCLVTSPPYYQQRKYSSDNELGQEKTPQEYINNLANIFDEAKKVLRDDGVCWIVIGNKYGKDGKLIHAAGMLWTEMQKRGWIFREDIIWFKTNGLCSSVENRPTVTHEYVLMFTKFKKYYYDADAIREPHKIKDERLRTQYESKFKNREDQKQIDGYGKRLGCHILGKNKRSVWALTTNTNFKGEHVALFPSALAEIPILASTSQEGCCDKCGSPLKRLVDKGKHIRELQQNCGGPNYNGQAIKSYREYKAQDPSDLKRRILEGLREKYTIGWIPTCKCKNIGIVPCNVIDPFNGAASTGVAALKNGRNYIGIDINPKYIQMSKQRLLGHVSESEIKIYGEC